MNADALIPEQEREAYRILGWSEYAIKDAIRQLEKTLAELRRAEVQFDQFNASYMKGK